MRNHHFVDPIAELELACVEEDVPQHSPSSPPPVHGDDEPTDDHAASVEDDVRDDPALDALRRRVDVLQRQLDALQQELDHEKRRSERLQDLLEETQDRREADVHRAEYFEQQLHAAEAKIEELEREVRRLRAGRKQRRSIGRSKGNGSASAIRSVDDVPQPIRRAIIDQHNRAMSALGVASRRDVSDHRKLKAYELARRLAGRLPPRHEEEYRKLLARQTNASSAPRRER